MLYDFVPAGAAQADLFGNFQPGRYDASCARMQAVDTINTRFGRNRIYYAAEDLSKSWQPKHSLRSPSYVSSWNELPQVEIR
jgi:DNA polymerase V